MTTGMVNINHWPNLMLGKLTLLNCLMSP